MAEAKKTVKNVKAKDDKKLSAQKDIKEASDGDIQKSPKGTPKADSQEKIDKAKEPKDKTIAKAGKRSAKAIKESEEKAAKEARKEAVQVDDSEPDNSKPVQKQKTRTAEDKLKSRGKKYQTSYAKIDKNNSYDPKAGVELAISTASTKFDSTIELHLRLGVDPKQADQNIRDVVALPAGTGKAVRIAVFAEGDDLEKAKKSGADIVGSDDLLEKFDKNDFDFNVLIATPSTMPKLGKYARILGPKGLMPNPKSGTVTKDITKAVSELKSGRLDYRVDSYGIIHAPIGKVSFGADKILQNLSAIMSSIKANKPSSLKGNYILSSYLTCTMGPSIKIDNSGLTNL